MFAFKDIDLNVFNEQKENCNGFLTEADREVLESDLCFVAAFAL